MAEAVAEVPPVLLPGAARVPPMRDMAGKEGEFRDVGTGRTQGLRAPTAQGARGDGPPAGGCVHTTGPVSADVCVRWDGWKGGHTRSNRPCFFGLDLE